MKPSAEEWRAHLDACIAFARLVEGAVAVPATAGAPGSGSCFDVVALGTLVRSRRCAEAVRSLGKPYAYEAQILSRVLMELYVNLRWILLRDTEKRAERFLAYTLLERHATLEKTPEEERRADHAALLASANAAAASVKHLFRHKTKKGQLKVMGWALEEIQGKPGHARERKPTDRIDDVYSATPRTNLRMPYGYLSLAVHGAPHSLEYVLDQRDGKFVAREVAGDEVFALSLAAVQVRDVAALVAGHLAKKLEPELQALTEELDRLTGGDLLAQAGQGD